MEIAVAVEIIINGLFGCFSSRCVYVFVGCGCRCSDSEDRAEAYYRRHTDSASRHKFIGFGIVKSHFKTLL